MPLSMDEATKRYEGDVQNIQDSIYTIESYLGAGQSFTFNTPQVIGNLDKVDLLKEERNTSLQIHVLDEYKKIISNEKKRRSMMDVIQAKKKSTDFKANLKTKRRPDRVVVNPYQEYKQQAQQENITE